MPHIKPSANFSLNEKQAKEITNLEIGERYTVTLSGIITNLSKSKHYNSIGMDLDAIHFDAGLKGDIKKMKRRGLTDREDEE